MPDQSQQLDIESLDALIKAVNDYLEELNTNRAILVNAADACDAAMGSDAIAKKHIGNLKVTLAELEKTAKLAAEVSAELIEDRNQAMDVLED